MRNPHAYMNKAVFLDRDGTINIDKHYLYKIDDFEFLPGVLEGLRLLYDAGFLLILVTNQSGIGRGYFTEEQYGFLQSWLEEKLKQNGSPLAGSYYCPHSPDAKLIKYRVICDCRKPKPGMLLKAARDFNIDLTASWMIGDRKNDVLAGKAAGCHTTLLHSTDTDETVNFNTSSLLEAAKNILKIHRLCI